MGTTNGTAMNRRINPMTVSTPPPSQKDVPDVSLPQARDS
jgi:hypothetical protein